ncbi:MAG: hemolysin III family protein [Bacteroidaceae bacterium]
MTQKDKLYSPKEEKWNSFSHLLGIILGLSVMPYLFNLANNYSFLEDIINYPDTFSQTTIAIRQWLALHAWIAPFSMGLYFFGMLSSYTCSTVYHALPNGKAKKRWRHADHAAIYFQIAGTYAPVTILLLTLSSYWGFALFLFQYIAAITGTFFDLKPQKQHNHIETICYIVMGLSALVAIHPMYEILSIQDKMPVLWWILAGGVSYIIGALFYSLHNRIYMHTIFHFFVLGGSICHIIALIALF